MHKSNKFSILGQIFSGLNECVETTYFNKFDYVNGTPFLDEILEELYAEHVGFHNWVNDKRKKMEEDKLMEKQWFSWENWDHFDNQKVFYNCTFKVNLGPYEAGEEVYCILITEDYPASISVIKEKGGSVWEHQIELALKKEPNIWRVVDEDIL